ncbi:hypothetical protein ACN6MY_20035 [Peribacillus sp. B-H-3]|uniref:hypothetical protein n=1 Tax=Peribacillus sp. B-H-3 TaxID=3400420 RepID=UPI003B0210E9
MRSILLYTCLVVLIASLMSCQKKEGEMLFGEIYPANYITKIEIKEKNGKRKEITRLEDINKWIERAEKIKFIRDQNQEERELLLTYEGCLVKAYRNEKEVGDFILLKLNGVYYKRNVKFDKQVESLCE